VTSFPGDPQLTILCQGAERESRVAGSGGEVVANIGSQGFLFWSSDRLFGSYYLITNELPTTKREHRSAEYRCMTTCEASPSDGVGSQESQLHLTHADRKRLDHSKSGKPYQSKGKDVSPKIESKRDSKIPSPLELFVMMRRPSPLLKHMP
jgi:hypothetical protein